ncbi:hypothetical protein AYY16_13025 [Morganella psychrotolerans]|uniref:hypothetical protein n=1 Tax=Morganella psychrotolerans TaxID=368603 RepID=UPI0007FCCC2B|nr:hypothetical protein [Morganella psychrotolerans]OBU03962.1 hypothetical protein AYY16_13025 [Morganella psychrotolerans]
MAKMSKLHKQADEYFKLLEEQKYEKRATHIFGCEPSLAVFLLWCNIEVLLRLNKYYHKIQEPWPDKLSFINANWAPLKHIKGINVDAYNAIFGSSKSLWKIRNEIAHTGKFIEEHEVIHFVEYAKFVIDRLNSELPKRSDFLVKKKA